jgi:hypothetical protein
MTGKHFAQIPDEVLTADAFKTLPNYAVRVLVAIAAQYRGNNNGDLAMTWNIGQSYGITSKEALVASLADLQRRGLIQKTKQGGKRPLGPTLYGITWQPISDLKGKIESGATTAASNAWADWKDSSTGLPADQSKINPRDCRRTGTGLPADQTSAVTGLPADQTQQINGTAGSPPSRSWREGAGNRVRPASSSASESVIQSVSAHGGRGTRNSDSAGLDARILKLMRAQPHLPDSDIAKIMRVEISAVSAIRQSRFP